MTKKLALKTETLRTLHASDLDDVDGGLGTNVRRSCWCPRDQRTTATQAPTGGIPIEQRKPTKLGTLLTTIWRR